MIDQLIETERGRDRLMARIARAALPFRATVTDGRPRSHRENNLMWVWAGQAASQLQDTTVRELQQEWKLRFGVPQLMLEDPKFADMWAVVERAQSYSMQLRLMEYVEVTSKLSVKAFAAMLDEIFRYYAENGIELTDPDETRYGPKIGSRVDRPGTGCTDSDICETQGGTETEGKVRGLYTGLQREAEAGDTPRTTPGSRRGE